MDRTTCCESSVGALVTDTTGRLLMVTRAWHPIGVAPVAGHVWDAHSDPLEALAAEIREESGLTLAGSPALVWSGWVDNRCQSRPGPKRGHYWWLYRAETTGVLAPDMTETKGADWYTRDQVQALADRTIAWLYDLLSDDEFEDAPGLEPVWIEHLAQLGMVTADGRARDYARAVYSQEPAEYWPPSL